MNTINTLGLVLIIDTCITSNRSGCRSWFCYMLELVLIIYMCISRIDRVVGLGNVTPLKPMTRQPVVTRLSLFFFLMCNISILKYSGFNYAMFKFGSSSSSSNLYLQLDWTYIVSYVRHVWTNKTNSLTYKSNNCRLE